VAFADKGLQNSFYKLRDRKFEDKELYTQINKTFDTLKQNPFSGTKIPKNLWPKEYIIKYEIDNLWKYDLQNAWRLIYTLRGDEIKIISVILEWFDHKSYERKFKY